MGMEPPERMKTVSFLKISCIASVGFDVLIIRAHNARWTFTPHFNVRLNTLGRELLHVFFKALENVVGILVRHQPHRNFRRGFRGDDRLRARSGKSARHAMNFERWSRPGAM